MRDMLKWQAAFDRTSAYFTRGVGFQPCGVGCSFSKTQSGSLGQGRHAAILLCNVKKWSRHDLLLAEPEMRVRAQFLIPNIEIEQHADFAIGIGKKHVQACAVEIGSA